MVDRMTAPLVRTMKESGAKIVAVTAYDSFSGALVDEAGADIALVGDSVGNVLLGYESTLPVTMEDMVHHTAAVARVVNRPLLVADMPFGSYQSSVAQAVESGVRLVRAGAHAVKLEGAYIDAITALVMAGIPVMGHLGMTPQSVHKFGGHKVQGKGAAEEALVEDAKRLESAGVFAIVLELVPAVAAKRVTESINIPTIGIGAGPHCDGQVQVFHDLLGLTKHKFRHAKRYIEGYDLMLDGVRRYICEVRAGEFPESEHST